MKRSMVWLTFCCIPRTMHIRCSLGQLIRFIAGRSITSLWTILQSWVWPQADLIDERIKFWTRTWSQGCFGGKNDKISWHLPIVSRASSRAVSSRRLTIKQHKKKKHFTVFPGHRSGQGVMGGVQFQVEPGSSFVLCVWNRSANHFANKKSR